MKNKQTQGLSPTLNGIAYISSTNATDWIPLGAGASYDPVIYSIEFTDEGHVLIGG